MRVKPPIIDPQPVADELSGYCTQYYRLKQDLFKMESILQNLLDDTPFYIGQTDLIEIDAIISHQREVEATQAEISRLHKEITITGLIIQKLMKMVGVPAGLQLTGVIPGELEYMVWADQNAEIYISKTKELNPEPQDPNVVTIKCTDGTLLKIRIIDTAIPTASSEHMVYDIDGNMED